MAKTKEITIGEQKFTLQSVSPSWYYDFNDECGNTGSGKRHGAFWYNVGRFVYVPLAALLCGVALIAHVAF